MQLIIALPTNKQKIEIAWAEFNTITGNYVIQEGHAPTVLLLLEQKPFIYCLKDGKQEVVMVQWGIVEITRTTITVLLNMAKSID